MSTTGTAASDRALYQLELELEGLPDIQRLRYAHWTRRFRADKRWKQAVQWAAVATGLPDAPLLHAHIDVIRFASQPCDFDGLVGSMKPLLDGLKPDGGYRGVIVDDSMEHITTNYRYCRTTGDGRVRIVVTERRP